MNRRYLFLSLAVAAVFFVYDLWLIGAGLFLPATLIGVVVWLALLMFAARFFRRPSE